MSRLSSPEHVLQEIEQELATGSESVLVLATCGYMLRPLLAVLRKRGIPFANPYRPARGDWNPLRRGMGWRLKAFADERPTWAQAWTWVEMLDTAKAGIARGAKKLIKDALRDEAFAKAPFELYEYHAFLGEHLPTPGGDRIPWLVDNVLAKHRKPLDFPLRVYEAQGLSALSDKPRVMVGTVHSVKGGEADSVLLYPDISKKAWTSQTQDPGDLQRTVYVGMTRAKRRLLLGQRSEKSRAVRW